MMHSKTLATALSVALAAVTSAAGDAEPRADEHCGPARLRLDRRALDFGVVGRHTRHTRTVQLFNDTHAPLRFAGGGSDCVCLQSQTRLPFVSPGGSVDWRVCLDVCEYIGEARRRVWLWTPDGEHRLVELAVRYRVVPQLYIQPAVVNLGWIASDALDAVEATVRVRTAGSRPLRLLEATSRQAALFAFIEQERVTPTTAGTLRVCLYPPLPEGRLQATIWLASDSAELERIRVPVLAESVEGLGCDRREVVFDDVPLGAVQSQRVTLLHTEDTGVAEVYKTNEVVDIAEIKRAAGSVVIELRTAARLPLGEFAGHLLIRVAGGGRKLKLPYRGRVVEPPAGERTADRAEREALPSAPQVLSSAPQARP